MIADWLYWAGVNNKISITTHVKLELDLDTTPNVWD
jgi:hypothetical protein